MRGEVGDEFAFAGVLGGGFSTGLGFLAQINFHRRLAVRTAQQRPFAHAAADHRFFVVVLIIVLLHFGFDGRRGVLELPDERAAGNLDD